jgi:hypothetical protein
MERVPLSQASSIDMANVPTSQASGSDRERIPSVAWPGMAARSTKTALKTKQKNTGRCWKGVQFHSLTFQPLLCLERESCARAESTHTHKKNPRCISISNSNKIKKKKILRKPTSTGSCTLCRLTGTEILTLHRPCKGAGLWGRGQEQGGRQWKRNTMHSFARMLPRAPPEQGRKNTVANRFLLASCANKTHKKKRFQQIPHSQSPLSTRGRIREVQE